MDRELRTYGAPVARVLSLFAPPPLSKATRDQIAAAARQARAPRSDAEAEAGTYRKGHIALHGMRIAIESRAGGWRKKFNKDGTLRWKCRMPAHYGYVKGSMGADGDQVDVYLAEDAADPACPVFVFDQHKLSGEFDEHKTVLGARTRREATAIYDGGFSDGSGPRRRRGCTIMTVEEFRSKALGGRMGKPLAKAAPEDDEPSDDETPPAQAPDSGGAEKDLARRLARLFRSWLDTPNRVGDETDLAAALAKPFQRAMRAGQDAAQIPPTGGGSLPGVDDPGRVLAFSFDRRNPEVQRRLEQYSLSRIRAISAESREGIRAAVISGAQMGLPIPDQARRIRESIGLSPGQVGWVYSYRRQLETLDPRALGRALRDRRFDSPISRAVSSGVPLEAEAVDRYVEAYQRRTLAYRATTIARTEALRGSNTGMVETARVALLSMPDMTVEKTWIATKDEFTRDTHRELDGKTVLGLDTPFEVDGKQIRWPHDDQASADEVVNCRCTFGVRVIRKPGAGRFTAEAVSPE